MEAAEEYRVMHETFRIKRSIRNQMLACLAFFIAIGTASVCAFLFDPKTPHPWLGALFTGAFWFSWVGASLCYLLVCWKSRLIVDGDRITKVGVLGRKELALGAVSETRWRNWPKGGSVVLKSPDVRMTVDFNEYTVEQRDRLVRYLRERLSRTPQVGWTLFAYQITSGETKEREPLEGDVVIDRRRWDRLFLWMTPLFLATGAFLGWQSDRWTKAFPPLVPLVFFWGLMRFMTPSKGMICQPLSKEEWAPGQLKVLLGSVACLPLLALIQRLPVTEGTRSIVYGIVSVTLLAGFILWMYRTDRWIRRTIAERAEAAAIARGERPDPRSYA